jgi:ABC-type cobalt transport system substrate-binding protein
MLMMALAVVMLAVVLLLDAVVLLVVTAIAYRGSDSNAKHATCAVSSSGFLPPFAMLWRP